MAENISEIFDIYSIVGGLIEEIDILTQILFRKIFKINSKEFTSHKIYISSDTISSVVEQKSTSISVLGTTKKKVDLTRLGIITSLS
jgi:hypothetical protein